MPAFHKDGTSPGKDWIFVFGSNQAGYHAGGAAHAAAEQFEAAWGVGEGPTGRAYAIPTMDKELNPRSLDAVEDSVQLFVMHAKSRPDEQFFVTRVGCGIAGFRDDQIAPMFVGASDNCSFAESWRRWLEGEA